MAGRLGMFPPARNRAAMEGRRRAMAQGEDRSGEIAACAADPARFCDSWCVIDDTQGLGDGLGRMPFRLWPDQFALMAEFATNRRVIALKARQLGISWLVLAYALHLAIFRPGQLVVLLSKDEDAAKEMLRRVKVMYERLPEWLKRACPRTHRNPDSTTVYGWANGSTVKSFAATKGAGRSFTASLVIMDEAAWMMYAKAVYTAAGPTMEAGGKLFLISTANGAAGLFYDLWRKAEAGLNEFKAVFLPWWSRPGRDDAWYAKQVANSTDPMMVLQEFPATPTEAFIASGRVRFPLAWITAQDKHAKAPIADTALWPESLRPLEGLTLYEAPVKGEEYCVTADVAEGKEGGDYCAGVVVRKRDMAEVATLHGRWEPDEFGRRLFLLGGEYFRGPIVVERNNHGHAVLLKLKLMEYPNIARGHDGHPGWITTPTTKPQMVDALAVRLRDDRMKVRHPASLAELKVYRTMPNGGTEAPQGEHDDLVMAWAALCGWLDVAASRETVFY